jgi:death-on-curing protein
MNWQNNVNWLDETVVLAIHEAQIAENGGMSGVRDHGLLASALVRSQNAAAYSKTDIAGLAALYALGVIRNHPFIDGNKRVGMVLLETFLELHNHKLAASDDDLLATIRAVAAGEMSDEDFSAWVRERTRSVVS